MIPPNVNGVCGGERDGVVMMCAWVTWWCDGGVMCAMVG